MLFRSVSYAVRVAVLLKRVGDGRTIVAGVPTPVAVDVILIGDVLILDPEGAPKGRGKLENLSTSGGQTATRRTEWVGKLEPGPYGLIFTFDLGEGQLLVEERKMTVEAPTS